MPRLIWPFRCPLLVREGDTMHIHGSNANNTLFQYKMSLKAGIDSNTR
jgi:hypothetical protein